MSALFNRTYKASFLATIAGASLCYAAIGTYRPGTMMCFVLYVASGVLAMRTIRHAVEDVRGFTLTLHAAERLSRRKSLPSMDEPRDGAA